MDALAIAHWRMRNLRLSGQAFDSPEDVVSWLGAVQSQDYGPAKWSLAQRTGGIPDAVVERAFTEGRILRTHVLRPTWHFLLPADIRWMVELTAPRVLGASAYYLRQLELDEATLGKTGALIGDALGGGKQLTRNELAARLQGAGIVASGLRLGYIMMHAEMNGIICSGAMKGKQHTYALLDERAPRARRLSREEALAELTLRYFSSHGPATVADFKAWSSLTVADIRRGLAAVASRLEQEVFDGDTYWFTPSAPHPPPPSPVVYLLQAYDEYFAGYGKDRYAILNASGAALSQPLGGASFNHVVVLDSQGAGRWKRTLTKGKVVIDVTLHAPFDAPQTQALQAEADRHGRFLGLAASVVTAAG